MPFYRGRSADGSDMEEFEGVYINPRNPNEFCSQPYPEQQRFINMKNILLNYMNGRYTLDDVYKQIQNKTCPLSKKIENMYYLNMMLKVILLLMKSKLTFIN